MRLSSRRLRPLSRRRQRHRRNHHQSKPLAMTSAVARRSRFDDTVVRINQRTATIDTGNGHSWRVPFHMHRHVLDI